MADERKIGAVEIDRLYDFLDGLQASGYTIDPRQYLALSDLLMALIARGDSVDELPLKTLIAPLICSTPAEQQDFYLRFDRWYLTLLPVKQASLSADGIALPPTSKQRWSLPTINRTAVIWVTVVVAVITLIVWLISNSVATGTQVINSTVSLYGTIFAVFGFIVWLGWRTSILYQENQYITRELANQEPVYTKVPVKAYIQDVMPVLQFKPIVSALRKRIQVPSAEVDVDRTIENALNRDNWLEVVYRQRQVMPEYVVLIDRKNRLDQQARFVQEMLEKLSLDGVWLHQYEFNGDPRICFPLDRKDTPLRLKDLQSRHPDSRLLVFSGTNELINPLTGLLQDWLESLSYWQERAILTPDKLQKVLLEELAVKGFAILSMTLDGLASIVRAFEANNTLFLIDHEIGLPAQFIERPMRWIGRDKPSMPEVKTLINNVKNYLGEGGFYWLCATAVYPELRWELTLHLGNALKDSFGQSVLRPDTLIRIAHLPWFRIGYMPDWIRHNFVESFNSTQEALVRETLGELLSSTYNGQGFDLVFSQKPNLSFQNLSKRFLRALKRNTDLESPLQDQILITFVLNERTRKLAVLAPERIRDSISTLVNMMRRTDTQDEIINNYKNQRIRKTIFPPFSFLTWSELLIWLGVPTVLAFFSSLISSAITAGYNFISSEKRLTQLLVWVVFALLNLLYTWRSYHHVAENERFVVFRAGKVVGNRGPGHVLLLPIIDYHKGVDVRERLQEILKEPCITRENILVSADLYINWYIYDPALSLTKVSKLEDSMQLLSAAVLRASVAEYTVHDVKGNHASLNNKIYTLIEKKAFDWGVAVTHLAIKFHMPNNYLNKIETS